MATHHCVCPDLAFVDRADIKQYIGPPPPKAIYTILASCLGELMRAGIIAPRQTLVDARAIESWLRFPHDHAMASVRLYGIAQQCTGFSGRMLRKLPFLAHAAHTTPHQHSVTLDAFLTALSAAVDTEQQARRQLAQAAEMSLCVQKLSLDSPSLH